MPKRARRKPGAREELIPVFIPALVALLEHAEVKKGAPLTRSEVEAIRDGGVCMMMPVAQAADLAKSRGYPDLDPENCWQQWKNFRSTARRKKP